MIQGQIVISAETLLSSEITFQDIYEVEVKKQLTSLKHYEDYVPWCARRYEDGALYFRWYYPTPSLKLLQLLRDQGWETSPWVI